MKWLTLAYVFGALFALPVGVYIGHPENLVVTPVAYVLGTYACAYILMVLLEPPMMDVDGAEVRHE